MKRKIPNHKSQIPNKFQIPISKLVINVQGRTAIIQFSGKNVAINLCENSLLRGIDKVARDMKQISGIQVFMHDVSFSVTRQVVALVNTLAWQLGIKVNGKKQINAEYSKEPNITYKTKI